MEWWGGTVAQLVERRTQDPMTRGSNPVRVKNVMLTRCQCDQPPCVVIRVRMIMYAH